MNLNYIATIQTNHDCAKKVPEKDYSPNIAGADRYVIEKTLIALY